MEGATYSEEPAATEGHAATQAERKDTKSLQDCQDQGMKFIPICVEACGNWRQDSQQTLY